MTTVSELATPDEDSSRAAARALESVQSYLVRNPTDSARVRVSDDDGEIDIVVPRIAVELMSRVLAHLAEGQGVSIVPARAELTTQQAADLLNVSRPYLIGLLESGKIDFRRVGTHRRVQAGSLMEYKSRDDVRRREAADELTTLAQDMGLTEP